MLVQTFVLLFVDTLQTHLPWYIHLASRSVIHLVNKMSWHGAGSSD